ncbi:hypothetical protein Agub_g11548 [Astrephomene gubernaculifera]|uniref:Uncharacterized protein n=1 Tax=Astrephomene gubernaculifera TaxID=47775 RepID=A0AAD3DZI8_9CHLO|nr:hypothetical protein Agub_g11548 [Astrephomene gubernaculifera]
MEDTTNAFRLARQPRKPGSGWQPRPRAFPLTINLTGISVGKRRRLLANIKPSHKAPENGVALPSRQAASPERGLLVRPASPIQPMQPSPVEPTQPAKAVAPEEDAPIAVSVQQVFVPSESRAQRVFVALGLKPGSGRRVQPRSYTLSFKPPPPPPPPSPPPPPVPAQRAAASPLPSPSPGPSPSVCATPAPNASVPCALQDASSPFMPQLEDLYTLAMEIAASRPNAFKPASAAHAMLGVGDSAAEASTSYGATASADGVGSAAGLEQPEVVPQSLLPARTPAPNRCAALSPLSWFLRSTPARSYMTPVEGVPEKPLERTCAARVEGAPVPSPAATYGTPIEGVPERLLLPGSALRVKDAGPATRPGACSSAFLGMTPVEGVPERMLKRPRLHSPESARRAAGGGGRCGLGPMGSWQGPVACGIQQAQADQSAPGPLEGADGGEDEGCAALGQDAAGIGCDTVPCGDEGVPITGPALAECSAAPDPPPDLTVSDVAAAAIAATRIVLLRLQPEADAEPSGGPPEQPVDLAPERAVAPHASTSVAQEPSPTPSNGTPAVVKINNVAAAVANAVRRATEAMGGPPSCRASQPLRGALPPRPPSTTGHGSVAANRPLIACSRDSAAFAARHHRTPSEADGARGLEDLIHRAPPGALIFPSRTPSPMGGCRRALVALEPGPQLDAGTAAGVAMVTPTLAGAAAALAAGGAPAADASPASSAATPGVTGQSMEPPRQVHEARGASSGPHIWNGRRASGHAAAASIATEAEEVSGSASDGVDDNGQDWQADDDPHDGLYDAGVAMADNGNDQEDHRDSEPVSSSEDGDAGSDDGDSQDEQEDAHAAAADEPASSSEDGDAGSDDGDSEDEQDADHAAVADQPASSSEGGDAGSDDDGSEDEHENAQVAAASPPVSSSEGGDAGSDDGDSEDERNRDHAAAADIDDSKPDAGDIGGMDDADAAEDSILSNGADAGGSEMARSDPEDSPRRADHGGNGNEAPEPDSMMYQGNDEDTDDDVAMKEEVRALPEEPETAPRGSNGNDVHDKDAGKGAPAGEQPGARAAASKTARGKRAANRPAVDEGRRAADRKSLAGAGLVVDDVGVRRSTRNRVRPLEYWRGEVKSYGRDHKSLITVKSIHMRTPEPEWPLPTGKQGRAKRKARAVQAAAAAMDG